MEKVDIVYNRVEEAISVMKEVAQWGREQGFRVWLDEWLTSEELITEEAKPEDFCVGKVDGKTACAFILQKHDSEYWCQTAHCGRGKSHFIFGGLASPMVPYRNLPQASVGMTADCRSLV